MGREKLVQGGSVWRRSGGAAAELATFGGWFRGIRRIKLLDNSFQLPTLFAIFELKLQQLNKG